MQKEYRSSFTSRQFMLAEDFEIYYYSDLHLKPVESHMHSYYEFYFPLEGTIHLEIKGKDHLLSMQDIAIIPPGTLHRAYSSDEERPYRRFIFWISKAYAAELTSQSMEYAYLTQMAANHTEYIHHFSENEIIRIHTQILQLLEEIHSNHFARDEFIRLSVRELILLLSRMTFEHDHPDLSVETKDLLSSVMSYIQIHLDEDLSLSMLAGKFFVSKYYLSHLFKDSLGVSVHQYILQKRLNLCAQELINGKEVTRVYHMHGFHDYSSFYRSFRKQYFLSPKEYQNVYLKDPEKYKIIK